MASEVSARIGVAPAKAVKMLPVTIEAPSVLPLHRPSTRRAASSLLRGSIEIEYAGATVRVRGMVDTEALRVVLETLCLR